jgi:hypothetical protein
MFGWPLHARYCQLAVGTLVFRRYRTISFHALGSCIEQAARELLHEESSHRNIKGIQPEFQAFLLSDATKALSAQTFFFS